MSRPALTPVTWNGVRGVLLTEAAAQTDTSLVIKDSSGNDKFWIPGGRSGIALGKSGTLTVLSLIGTGSPEGVETAGPGSTYQRSDGTFWLKATGAGNTGWFLIGPVGPLPVTFSATGALTTRTGASRWYNDTGRTISVAAIRIAAGTAPTGASLICDVNKNGTTLYTTQGNRPTVAISGNTQKATLPDVLTFADGDYMTVDIDQIGSTVAGSDLALTVWLSG